MKRSPFCSLVFSKMPLLMLCAQHPTAWCASVIGCIDKIEGADLCPTETHVGTCLTYFLKAKQAVELQGQIYRLVYYRLSWCLGKASFRWNTYIALITREREPQGQINLLINYHLGWCVWVGGLGVKSDRRRTLCVSAYSQWGGAQENHHTSQLLCTINQLTHTRRTLERDLCYWFVFSTINERAKFKGTFKGNTYNALLIKARFT